MTRISLKEAYDNRDVIAWLVKHQDAIDEFRNILENINPDGDLTNIVLKTGDQIIDGRKTFIGEIVAECDIIQNGAAYETHAEQIFSHNDYIVMRDGALNGLAAGSYSGLQVKKYDGTNDVRMVVDNTGVMRVGKINDEEPLLLRDEAADLTDGALLKWDATDKKAINEGTVGDDNSPIKLVNGVPTPVSSSKIHVDATGADITGYVNACMSGKVVVISSNGTLSPTTTGLKTVATGLPVPQTSVGMTMFVGSTPVGYLYVDGGGTLYYDAFTTTSPFGSYIYIAV